jgi:hypothetical protein
MTMQLQFLWFLIIRWLYFELIFYVKTTFMHFFFVWEYLLCFSDRLEGNAFFSFRAFKISPGLSQILGPPLSLPKVPTQR